MSSVTAAGFPFVVTLEARNGNRLHVWAPRRMVEVLREKPVLFVLNEGLSVSEGTGKEVFRFQQLCIGYGNSYSPVILF